MTKVLLFLLFIIPAISTRGQSNLESEVTEWKGSTETPLIFYISGDGGINNFTSKLSAGISQGGYQVFTLNARNFFWGKKVPQQVADELASFVQSRLANRKNQRWMLIGYSFGADVMPFIINRLPGTLKSKLSDAIFLAPSPTTDFQIRLLDMAGMNRRRSLDVVAEINKMAVSRTVIITEKDGPGFPVDKIRVRNLELATLRGGHHFEGNIQSVTATILNYLK
jgi:type IV secretory pathway VirJ component